MKGFFTELQNLREAIATYRNSILRQPDEMKRQASLSFFVEYLERYYFLICFAVYIHTERAALCSSSFGHSSFADWMKARPELYSIIRRYIYTSSYYAKVSFLINRYVSLDMHKLTQPNFIPKIAGITQVFSLLSATSLAIILYQLLMNEISFHYGLHHFMSSISA